MKTPNQWRTAGLVAGALFIGSIVGPPLANAATAGLIRLEGGGSSHLAKVNNSGQLSVDAGLPMTSAGQVKIAEASPGSLIARFGYTTCASGGIYKVPAGKALIITSVDFFNGQQPPGAIHNIVLTAGPAATPCTYWLAAQSTPDLALAQNQVFPTGIPVPAGDAVGLGSTDTSGSVEIYGYLVPAAAVPKNALSGASAAGSSGLISFKPRH